ncbi:hypothetical protein KIN20_023247 [Parelaphostrongylus tenuis]|uniref:Peptidase M13 C-terminal domain-containing protein n=1 Tax=Parelaphostrongylus tenuis TaxID=148309 RepID=A0AAD5MWL0_PARTN|nr:hypothetical protein KIN20_023247 [Parelaphostrongylus tenuis]
MFVPEAPLPVNYGAIGTVIGHEITHGFDNKGAQYDEAGNVRSWWDRSTWATFMKKMQCFVMQYGKQIEPTIKKNVNGHLTVQENIADNGGLRAAYEAYKMRCSREECTALPQMSSFTPEQLFFVAFANIWCQNLRSSVIGQIMESSSHALWRFRTNVPLQNFPPFAKAFQCPVGSLMNPREKCRVW